MMHTQLIRSRQTKAARLWGENRRSSRRKQYSHSAVAVLKLVYVERQHRFTLFRSCRAFRNLIGALD